jgi:hypothetical protein
MTNFVNKQNITIEYGKVLEMLKVISREINTVEDYVAWVREWRSYHSELVGGIKTLRDMKNLQKYGETIGTIEREAGMTRAICAKLTLRPFAKKLYDLRVERKANFKAGVYGDPTFNRRNEIAA